MAGYKENFGSNVDYAYGRGAKDITGQLERGVSNLSNMSSGVKSMTGEFNSARKSVKSLKDEIKSLQAQQDQVDKGGVAWIGLQRRIDATTKSVNGFKSAMRQIPFDYAEKSFGKLTKGLIGLNTSILTIGFDFLIDSIKRVYELQERWTKAIGGFNMKLGGMTAGLKGAQKAATQWSSTIRGLTDGDIGEGIEMFAEFTSAIGRVVKSGDGFSKLGVQMARGFNMGGAGAGQLLKVFENIGMSADDSTEMMKVSIKAANAAGIPVNMLSEDLAKSSTYMARFGKEGQKTLVTGAAYARKYDIALEQLKASVEGLDMFDEAAKTASRLNTVFGTTINSMDLMMEDDPAKRLEMIRQQFLAQGTTYDRLIPTQQRLLSETLKLTEEQTAALLSQANAGESYADFQKKAAKVEKNELSAKKMMEKQLQATAQTMYAFGMAFDRITVAIANAIKPLLVVFGLAKDSGKTFTGFGQVMESVTKTVEEFFNSLAGNKKWESFMKELAKDLIRAAKGLKEFVMDGRAADLVGRMAGAMKQFYTWVRDLAIKIAPAMEPLLNVFLTLSKHLDKIVIAWMALKGFNAMGGISGGGAMGAIAGKAGGGSKIKGAGRMAAGGIGTAAAGMIGGTGAGIGAGLGSMILGPIMGPIIGGLAGKAFELLLDSSKSQMEKAHDRLNEIIAKETATRESYENILELGRHRQQSEDRVRESKNKIIAQLSENAIKEKVKSITLNQAEAEMLQQRATELTMFGKNTKLSYGLLANLGAGSKLTAEQLAEVVKASANYETELGKLRDTTKQQADLQMAQLQVSGLGQAKDALEATAKVNEMELKLAKQELKNMGGSASAATSRRTTGSKAMSLLSIGMGGGDGSHNLNGPQVLLAQAAKGQITLTKDERKRLEQEVKIANMEFGLLKDQGKLQELQTDFVKQSTIIMLRSQIQGSSGFLAFKNEAAQKGLDDKTIFENYLRLRGSEIEAVQGKSGLDLARQGSNFSQFGRQQAQASPVSYGSPISSGGGSTSVNYGQSTPMTTDTGSQSSRIVVEFKGPTDLVKTITRGAIQGR